MFVVHQNSGERRRQDGGWGRGRGEGRGRGRGDWGKANIVQASSIFSMGVGPVGKQKIGKYMYAYLLRHSILEWEYAQR